jgi:hypothetical protein
MNWISINEKLPEVGQFVLVYTETRSFSPTYEMVTKFSKYGFEGAANVTHWMPLPEPPTK